MLPIHDLFSLLLKKGVPVIHAADHRQHLAPAGHADADDGHAGVGVAVDEAVGAKRRQRLGGYQV
jgi:hypothetical protein